MPGSFQPRRKKSCTMKTLRHRGKKWWILEDENVTLLFEKELVCNMMLELCLLSFIQTIYSTLSLFSSTLK